MSTQNFIEQSTAFHEFFVNREKTQLKPILSSLLRTVETARKKQVVRNSKQEKTKKQDVHSNRVMHTGNELEAEVSTWRVSGTWTTTSTRKPELKRRPIRPCVLILGTDCDHCLTRRSVLVDHRTVVHRKLREIVIHVHQMYDQRARAGLWWSPCTAFHTFSISPFPRCIIITCLSKHKYLFYATWWVSFWLLLSLFLSKFMAENTLLPDRQMAKQCCNTINVTIILPNSLKRTQIYIAQNKYLCLLRHIIMMHFGNGDKPNAQSQCW